MSETKKNKKNLKLQKLNKQRRQRSKSSYHLAAELIDKLFGGNASFQTLFYSQDINPKQIASVYALVLNTLRYLDVINVIIEKTLKKRKFFWGKASKHGYLVHTMLHDYLFNKEGIIGAGTIKSEIEKEKIPLKSELTKLIVKAHALSHQDLIPQSKRQILTPRYIRINTLKTTIQESISQFVRSKYTLVPTLDLTVPDTFAVDPTIPDLLAFSPIKEGRLHLNDQIKQGHVVMQDKPSVMAALALQCPPNSIVMDACAAPGMKTLVLAGMMNNSGVLFAVDRDRIRLGTLVSLGEKHGIKNVKAIERDFLEIDPFGDEGFGDVQYMLLDPSCSGSGIINNLDTLLKPISEEELLLEYKMIQYNKHGHPIQEQTSIQKYEILKFANNQKALLSHALKFPKLTRLVYSTCSVNKEENEDVVQAVLDEHPDWGLEKILEKWERRGLESYTFGDYCVRTDPKQDLMTGFFIACFVRKANSVSPTNQVNKTNGNDKSKAEETTNKVEPNKKRKPQRQRQNKPRKKARPNQKGDK